MSGLLHHDRVLVMRARRNLLALAWHDAPWPGHLPAVQREIEELHRAHGKYGLLNVVLSGTPIFVDQVREEGRRLVEATRLLGGVTAHVMVVDGFAGTATRMFLSTMLLMGRGRAAGQRVFSESLEACSWLSEALSRPQSPWTPAEIERVYAEVRSVAPRS